MNLRMTIAQPSQSDRFCGGERKAPTRLVQDLEGSSIVWVELLRSIQIYVNIAAQRGFEIVLKPLPNRAYRECYKT